MKKLRLSALLLSFNFVHALALDPQPDALFVRVVDVGAGLCCVVKMPDDHCMVYDAGNFQDSGKTAFRAITNLIPKNSSIDYLVLSHTDSDHVAGVSNICKNYIVRNIVHPGLRRFSTNWHNAQAAIKREVKNDHAQELNLAKTALTPGQHVELGGVTVSFLCGFSKPPADWDIADDSEKYNAGSIVVRLTYKGKSILFCGDAVGRHLNSVSNACINTEKFLVDLPPGVPIASDVMIAPHHGSDGASSPDFIRAVRPREVIFSAGHSDPYTPLSCEQLRDMCNARFDLLSCASVVRAFVARRITGCICGLIVSPGFDSRHCLHQFHRMAFASSQAASAAAKLSHAPGSRRHAQTPLQQIVEMQTRLFNDAISPTQRAADLARIARVWCALEKTKRILKMRRFACGR